MFFTKWKNNENSSSYVQLKLAGAPDFGAGAGYWSITGSYKDFAHIRVSDSPNSSGDTYYDFVQKIQK